ncbi:hydantoinase B/oxoprolinase family protein [Pseudonocardia dioxanivorans]|uniref:hydantoinase B/oxoprolinase family protein n=1 Tax=Pseudonocardia dioxanivorans TaxID=240495 RepID=UPI000CD017C0|nr:hydantoinase B/oxoprolinase family protein [Pseudonocardia dioxanivorans]
MTTTKPVALTPPAAPALDAITSEVLRNAFVTAVDLMAEQLLRTSHSFVIHARDFSGALSDANGDTVAQGSQDVAVQVGTLHFSAKAVLDSFPGDICEGDVFVLNDPYVGGTHFNDVRVLRPIFFDGVLLAIAQSNGHWADVGGAAPGSFDTTAVEHFGEGLRITPVRVWSRGRYLADVARLIAANTRAPEDAEGDLLAQAEATRVCEREVLRLTEKYGRDAVLTAFEESQSYVERVVRRRVSELPDGYWEAEDFIDVDPNRGDGLVPIRVGMRIVGDAIHYDLSGSHPAVGSFLNSAFGGTFSAVVAGTKTFFPDVPLNSGFYRPLLVNFGPAGTVVNASWPTAVTGFYAGPYEKIVSAIFQIWSEIVPARAISTSFNLEYLLLGGRDVRRGRQGQFMYYDWMAGGWGGRNGKDGSNATASIFGVGHAIQSIEMQERSSPILTGRCELRTDSGGPGEFRGGLGLVKEVTLTDGDGVVLSYCSDRARSVITGTHGGLPSCPHGLSINPRSRAARYLGALASRLSVVPGDSLERPSAGGGGFGDPLNRQADAVCADVMDGYVSVDRARKDYGVVVVRDPDDPESLRVDDVGTAAERRRLRINRVEALQTEPAAIAEMYVNGELDEFDLVRQFGVILDWGSGQLLERTTEQFRSILQGRCVQFWRM